MCCQFMLPKAFAQQPILQMENQESRKSGRVLQSCEPMNQVSRCLLGPTGLQASCPSFSLQIALVSLLEERFQQDKGAWDTCDQDEWNSGHGSPPGSWPGSTGGRFFPRLPGTLVNTWVVQGPSSQRPRFHLNLVTY